VLGFYSSLVIPITARCHSHISLTTAPNIVCIIARMSNCESLSRLALGALCNLQTLYILNPDRLLELFFYPFFILLLLPLVITFLPPHCHSLYFTTTNERTKERTSERTVTLPFPRHVHLLLTITNFLPFASSLLLLTPD
jgi:hypothetical protein